jgi:WD40 repeat protein
MNFSRLLTATLSCVLLLCTLTGVVAQRAPAQGRSPVRRASNAPRLVVQLGHGSFLNGFAAFSRDGRLVATGSAADAAVIVWDVESGREVRRLAGNFGPEDAQDYSWMWGDFSPDGRLFAVGTEPYLRLWDVHSGRLLRQVAHNEHFFAPLDETRPPLAFTPDGRRLVAQGRARLTWDTATGRLLSRALIKQDDSSGAQLSHSRLSTDGRLRVRHEQGVFSVTEKASGRAVGRVALAGEDGGSPPEVLAYALSPDARLLLSVTGSDEDHAIRLWDVKTGRLVRRLEAYRGDRSPFVFTTRGRIINASSPPEGGGLFRVREMLGGRETTWQAGSEAVTHFRVSADGRFVALANATYGEVYDAETGARLARVEARVPASEAGSFTWDFVGFTPDHTVTFHKAQTPTGAQTFRLDTRDWTERPPQPGLDALPLDNYNSYEQPFVMTNDTGVAAWESVREEPAGRENTQWVTVWHASAQARNKTFRVDTDIAHNARSALALAPDARRIAVATRNDGATERQAIVKVYDAATGRALFRLRAPGLRVVDMAWSPDGRKLATFAADGQLKLWDASNGRELRLMQSTADGTSRVQFSHDSRHLLAYGDDGFTRLYNAQTGAELCRLLMRADGTWIVLDPHGRFDADKPEELRGVHWVASGDPLKPLPLETFRRDYYEPRLLARLMARE